MDKSHIIINREGTLLMHDLLQEMSQKLFVVNHLKSLVVEVGYGFVRMSFTY